MAAQQALRNMMEAYIHTKREMCAIHNGPYDCVMTMEAHMPDGRIAVGLVLSREDITPLCAAAREQGAQRVLFAAEAHVRTSTLAEALAARSGDVAKAFHDGDPSVVEWIIVQAFDAVGLPLVPVLTVDVGYDDEGQPTFGEVVERPLAPLESSIQTMVREAMR